MNLRHNRCIRSTTRSCCGKWRTSNRFKLSADLYQTSVLARDKQYIRA